MLLAGGQMEGAGTRMITGKDTQHKSGLVTRLETVVLVYCLLKNGLAR